MRLTFFKIPDNKSAVTEKEDTGALGGGQGHFLLGRMAGRGGVR